MARKAKVDDEAPSAEIVELNASTAAQAKWRSSGLTDEDARKLRLEGIDGKEAMRRSGNQTDRTALFIPYFDLNGNPTTFFRLRYLGELEGFAKQAKKPQRFAQEGGTLNEVYLPPLGEVSWAVLLPDPTQRLFITEGELKAACATANGFPTLGLGGVDVWRSKKWQLALLPTLEKTEWTKRVVYIVFDSDAATKPDVTRALNQLASALTVLGARVHIVTLPPPDGGGKQGLDDFFVANGDGAAAALEALVKEAPEYEAGAALWKMNEEFAFIKNPKLVIERATGLKLPVQDFKDIHGNRWHHDYSNPDRPKKVQTEKVWREWPQRATLNGLTYAPGQPPGIIGDKWNLWSGWGVEPKSGNVDPWHRLLDFLFRSAPDNREWFERWCAHPLQYPGTKLFTSVAMWGVHHGTGKSQVGYTLIDIYGKNRNAMEIRNQQLKGSFNSWAEDKQFIMGDEVTGDDNRAQADRLKGMITQESVLINPKFIREYTINDCINYYFTSNHPDAFFIEDTDRRFFVHEVDGPPGPLKLYDEYDRWRKGDGPAHLFEYLLRLPLGDFRPSAAAPMTAAKQEMIRDNKSDLDAWVQLLKDNPERALVRLCEPKASKCDLYLAGELLFAFNELHPGRLTTQGKLSRALKKAGFRQVQTNTKETNSNRFYVVRNADKWCNARQMDAAMHWYEFNKK